MGLAKKPCKVGEQAPSPTFNNVNIGMKPELRQQEVASHIKTSSPLFFFYQATRWGKQSPATEPPNGRKP